MWLKSNVSWAEVQAKLGWLVGLALLAGVLPGCQANSPQPESVARQGEQDTLPEARSQRESGQLGGSSASESTRHSPAPPTASAGSPPYSPALHSPALRPPVVDDAAGNDAAGNDASWQMQFDAILAGKSDTLLLEGQPITPQQLNQLAQLQGSLEQLLIDAGGVDADSLPAILVLKQLTHLRLRNCPLEDSSFGELAASDLDHLRILNVPQARITARGIASLASLPKLVQLRLGGRQINDAAVAEIARLPELRSLHLIGPSLSDAALSELAQAPKLSSFYLDDCQLSDQAWEQLFAAKPKLHVHIDQQHHDRDPHRH